MSTTDTTILRDLAKRYLDICHKPVQQERRDLWRKKNSLATRESKKQKPIRPLIYVRAFAWGELPESRCVCEDPFYRPYENFLRHALFWDTFDDDSIFEPWVTLRARYRSSGWGLSGKRDYPAAPRGAFKVDYPIKGRMRENSVRRVMRLMRRRQLKMRCAWRKQLGRFSRSTLIAPLPIARGALIFPPIWGICEGWNISWSI